MSSVISTETWLRARRSAVRILAGNKRLFCSPKCPDRFWDPSSLPFNGHQDLPRG